MNKKIFARRFRIGSALLSLLLAAGTVSADGLDKVSKTISKASGKLKNRQIAVLPFPYHDGKEGLDSTIVSEKLVTKIASIGKLQVVERSLLEKVMSELKLQYSGAISQESAQKLGNVLGVEAILTGTLIDMGENEIEINARLINSESGLVLTAASEKITRTWPAEIRTASSASGNKAEKTDMSVYFHSRDNNDPRFQGSGEPAPEPGDARAPQARGLVFSDAGERTVQGFGSDEGFLEPPAVWAGERGAALPPDVGELQQAWESANRPGGPEASETKFLELRDGFYSRSNPRAAALSQLYYADALMKQERYDDALREARRVAKMDAFPRIRARALFVMARASEKSGREDAARSLYREIVQNYPFESRLIRASGRKLHSRASR